MKIRFFCLIITFCLCGGGLFAQNQSYQIAWKAPQKSKLSEYVSVTVLAFDGAIYNENNLPVFRKAFPLSQAGYTVSVSFNNAVYSVLNENEMEGIADLNKISETISIQKDYQSERKNPFAVISFVPLRKTKSGSIEKLLSFDLEINIIKSTVAAKKKKSFATSSVLADGSWYKIYTNSDGVFKITYQELQDAGIPVSSINPQNFRIYGNGGAILPENNSGFFYDDLQENSIYVAGESDGVFDQSDYILFYGQSPHCRNYNATKNQFSHTFNYYSDYTCFFLTYDKGLGKRIPQQASLSVTPDVVLNSFQEYAFHEKDSVNLIQSGREWYGEYFDITKTYQFSFSLPGIQTDSNVYIKAHLIARNTASSSTFSMQANGNSTLVSIPPVAASFTNEYAKDGIAELTFHPTSSQINVTITLSTASSIGWLDYVEINGRRLLSMSNSQVVFEDGTVCGTGKKVQYNISSATSNCVIWDVTNPIAVFQQQYDLNSGTASFIQSADSNKKFVAFNGINFNSVEFGNKLVNQNLHSLSDVDMVIVSHPDFISEARRLAIFHQTNDNYSVCVLTPEIIYNEFSSGKQDAGAIRNLMRMLYDKAATPSEMPNHLLLFGDASYDFKSRISGNTNFVPTFQSQNSLAPTASYASDDFYGCLDSGEGVGANGLLDIGVGRIVCKNIQEAKEAVDKIIRYQTIGNLVPASGNNCAVSNVVSNYADWKNILCFVADDEDGGTHLMQTEDLCKFIDTAHPVFNIDKIYLDSYQQVSTPGGQRFPEVNEAINRRMEKGCLIMNYIGHGGEAGWAHERILEIADIQGWNNTYNMPVFMTATCEFSRFDNPERVSAGEYVFLNPLGGGVALFTTTRLAYSSTNFVLSQNFYRTVFEKIKGQRPRLGEIIRLSKNLSGGTNNRNFTLLGDPGLKLAFPEFNIITTNINNIAVDVIPDTIHALSQVTVTGFVADSTGNKLSSFNGTIFPTIYDKPSTISTLSNDGSLSPVIPFLLQKNILYKGMASVANGDFSFSFVVPLDIAYNYGFGKFSYYSENGTTDANGYYRNVIIGGTNPNAPVDNTGPTVQVFMNDEKFAFGGTTDENPILIAKVNDENGVNTVGNGIGHDVTAIIDDDTDNPVVLNDYYISDMDSYKKGTVRYQFKDLEEGKHTIKFKIWDTYNNSSEVYSEFYVAKSENVELQHVFNYPNPFTTHTSFCFDHNQPCCGLDVQIKIFTISGKMVKTIRQNVAAEGFRVDKDIITWDGRDDFGDKLAKGVYIYQIKVTGSNGSSAEKFEKLVIL